MTSQQQKAESFHGLHKAGKPLILFNIWDAWSAKLVAGAGAPALATSSWAVAAAQGFGDGEKLPFETSLATVKAICDSSDLPVSMDIESGYGGTVSEVARNVTATIEAGAVGCNLEDSSPQLSGLRSIQDQAARVRACRQSAETSGLRYFINARTDVFFTRDPAPHDTAMVNAALERAVAYAQAGADGIFVPGLLRIDLLTAFCSASPLPVNVMLGDVSTDIQPLINAGVSRISYGPAAYLLVMKTLQERAKALFA